MEKVNGIGGLDGCMKTAKSDTDRKTCNDLFGTSQKSKQDETWRTV